MNRKNFKNMDKFYTLISMMPTLKYIGIYKFLVYLSIIVAFTLGSIPSSDEMPKVENLDKLLHFSFYFILASFYQQLMTSKHTIVLAFFIGVSVECIQYFLPYRSAEFLDLIANLVGILVAVFLVRSFSIFYLKFFESKLS